MDAFRTKVRTFSGIITLVASKISTFIVVGLVLILCVLVFSVLNLLCLAKKWVALEKTVIE